MTRLYKYEGLDLLNLPREERPCYCRFAICKASTNETLIEIYTNRDFKGAFGAARLTAHTIWYLAQIKIICRIARAVSDDYS